MPDHSVECEVDLNPQSVFGTFANAFRLLEEGDGCLLEFLVYSATEQRAEVVQRVQVRREFVPAIRDRMSESLGARDVAGFTLPFGGVIDSVS